MRRLIFIALISWTAIACAETEVLPRNDAGVVEQNDASVADAAQIPDAGGGPTFVFESHDPQSPALVFGDATFTADRFEVDVLGKGVANVHGLAFRVLFDPNVLSFAGFEKGAVLMGADVAQAAEARPGLLVVALGRAGAANGVDIDGFPVAKLTFARLAEVRTEVALQRGFVLDARGLEIKVALGTGNLVER